jgi:hypothetical protein
MEIKLYTSPHQKAAIPPGYVECQPAYHGELARVSDELDTDFLSVLLMPGSLLVKRYFAEYVVSRWENRADTL